MRFRRSPAAPPPGGIRGAFPRDRGAAALRCERQCDLGAARGARAALHRGVIACRAGRGVARRRPVGRQDATLGGSPRRSHPARSTSTLCPTLPRTAIHAALDRRSKASAPGPPISTSCSAWARADAWSPGDLALQHRGEGCAGSRRAAESPSRWSKSPKPGAPGAPSPRGCSGPITPCDAARTDNRLRSSGDKTPLMP